MHYRWTDCSLEKVDCNLGSIRLEIFDIVFAYFGPGERNH
jgi:hypothetical protein